MEKARKKAAFFIKNVVKAWSGVSGFHLSIDSLEVSYGDKLALVGYSGCGKSTLLDILAMILQADDTGEFIFHSKDAQKMDIARIWKKNDLDTLAKIRLHHMGYVLQTGGLLPFLTIRDNIGLSLMGLGISKDQAVESIAEKLGIHRHLHKLPRQLSVGERQRVAIARAMVHSPAVVIADEPTAALDPIKSDEVMTLFTQLADELGTTLIVATHEWRLVKKRNFRMVRFLVGKKKDSDLVMATIAE